MEVMPCAGNIDNDFGGLENYVRIARLNLYYNHQLVSLNYTHIVNLKYIASSILYKLLNIWLSK